MKKLIVLLLALTSGATLLTGCADSKAEGNYSDEMKIPYSCDLSPDDGADSVERLGDHKNSPYFNTLDFVRRHTHDSFKLQDPAADKRMELRSFKRHDGNGIVRQARRLQRRNSRSLP